MKTIRNATLADLSEIMQLQNSYIAEGFTGLLRGKQFEIEERKIWFSQFLEEGPHQLLVMYEDNKLLGYCGSFIYRNGEVFKKTVETTIYTSLKHSSKGVGTQLYKALFERISQCDLHLAVVGIALPNEASIKIHEKFGFENVGIFKEYAFFKEEYVSSLWMQKKL